MNVAATPTRLSFPPAADRLKTNGWCTDQGCAAQVEADSVAHSRWFAMRMERPTAEDALVAAGAAMVSGVPSLYVVPERQELPYFLREADLTYPHQITIVEGNPPLEQALTRLKPGGAPPSVPPRGGKPGAPPASSGRHFDTFIGCLMSGLDEQQYAEARSQLQTLDDLLKSRLGSPNNFCDGIKVSSPNSFERPQDCLGNEIDALRHSDRCVFYQYDGRSRPSGLWVELGGALALGKPSVLLTPDLQSVPPSLRQGAPGLEIVLYGSHGELFQELARDPETLVP